MARRTAIANDPLREDLLRRAIELARRGLESVSPNPMVGAVVARRGRIVGEGWHRRFGGPHAEVDALRRTADPRGADLYVTLEPCGHHGKTPPCAEAVARAGIRRVVYGAADPNPLTAGKGPRILRAHGIEVVGGVLEAECRSLDAPYFHWRETGRPWVILKWAMTLDGKIATEDGRSRWITGEAARAKAHALRRRVDAVLVGTDTVLADDPSLLPRPSRGRAPARIVLDRRARLPLELRLLSEAGRAGPGARIYVTGPRTPAARIRRLERRGIVVLERPSGRGPIPLPWLLETLGARGISQLLVEGGGELLGSFLAEGLAEEVVAVVAPRILGGRAARAAVGGAGLRDLESMPWLEAPSVRRVGRDLMVAGRLRWPQVPHKPMSPERL